MKRFNTNKLLVSVTVIAVAALTYSFTSGIDQDEWVVPAKYLSMENPTDASDSEDMSIGKSLYMQHCKSCHGKEGLGDGPKSEELDTPSGDFSTSEFQAQPDGALFYKIKEGRDDMPSFAKKIPDDEDIWLIVNFVKTLEE